MIVGAVLGGGHVYRASDCGPHAEGGAEDGDQPYGVGGKCCRGAHG
ncbi:hypothetical protein ACETU7_12690 [Rhodococcus sp. 3Y1]